MALKPYNELYQIDVMPYCDVREAKDDRGKAIKVPYLNWAKCKQLLHEHGAEVVYYEPIQNQEGGFLFRSGEAADKNGRKTSCYFVAVKIVIDDKTYRMDMPLMNGAYVVYDDTLNQLRISNCHARAFVKGVAIHTGLGFSLWSNDMDTESNTDDLSMHSLAAIKRRIEEKMTSRIKAGMNEKDIFAQLDLKDANAKTLQRAFSALQWLYQFEKELDRV